MEKRKTRRSFFPSLNFLQKDQQRHIFYLEQEGGNTISLESFREPNYRIFVTLLFAVLTAVIMVYFIAGTVDISAALMIIASIIFVAVTFINTNIGLVAILLSMLLSPEMEAGATSGRSIVIRAEDMVLIMVSLTWLAKMAVKKAPLIRQSPLNAPIGLYIAVMLFSTVRGMMFGDVLPLKGLFYVLKISEYFILFFIVLNITTTEKQVRVFLTVLFLVSLIVGIYGNTHIGSVSRISAPFEGEGEPNTLGGYLLFILSIAGGLLYCAKEHKLKLWMLLFFLLPSFLFTLSRASYMAMFVSLFTFIVITKDKRVMILLFAAAVCFLLIFTAGPPVIRDRVLGAFIPEKTQSLKKVGPISLGPSPAARVESWANAFKYKIPKHPFFGVGITGGGFLDSQYILTLLETGIIGFGLFLWLMWRVWQVAVKTYNTVETPRYKGLALGYLVGFAGLLVHAIGCNTFIIIRIAEPFWFFTAIVVKLVDIETGKAVLEEDISLRLRY
ncbi:MAG: O-antigen ligase family protein [Candidatus Omnitrophota bacterium]